MLGMEGWKRNWINGVPAGGGASFNSGSNIGSWDIEVLHLLLVGAFSNPCQSSGFENELQGRKRQFLLLKVKKLPACDLSYSSRSPVGWSGRGCHVKWLNDSRTECSCNHLTHFAVLMQFDTDSELKTGQNSRLQKVGYKTERTKVSL